jgi:hypothetical protein
MLRVTAAQLNALERNLFIERWVRALGAMPGMPARLPERRSVIEAAYDLASRLGWQDVQASTLTALCLASSDPSALLGQVDQLAKADPALPRHLEATLAGLASRDSSADHESLNE